MVTTVPLKGIKRYTVKGVLYHYHRKTGTRILAPFGTADFITEVAKLDQRVIVADTKPGTLEAVVAKYKASAFWVDLAPATKTSYDRALAHLKGVMKMPLRDFDPEFVANVRDKIRRKHGRWMANYVLVVLGILFDTATENGWVKSNPTEGVRRIKADKHRDRVNRPWDWQECRAVLDAAPSHLAVPIALAMLGGFRKGDVLSIKWDRVVDGRVMHRTKKTGAYVGLRLHPTLANILAGAKADRNKTVALNSRGDAWTESGFNSSFGKFIRGLEKLGNVKPGLTMHGLRHTMGTRLAEAGVDLATIAEILGQRTLAMAQHYSVDADRSERADQALENLRIFEPKRPSRQRR